MKKVAVYFLSLFITINIFTHDVYASEYDVSSVRTTNAELTVEQKNSIAMLNYLTVVTQEINASSNSKLLMEQIYGELINNTALSAVDEITQERITDLLNKIETYRMIAVKRERLDYIYEQNKAQAIKAAVPNPLGLIGAVQSFDWKKLVLSVAYMAVDSVTSYNAAKEAADLEYLQSGWALDDEAAENLHECRVNAYNYMADVVQDNNLPDELVLNENNVNNFVKWENEEDLDAKLRFFERNEKTYQNFGYYWIVLAQCYYQKDNYKRCIDCIKKYEDIQPKIFKIDHDYARAIPAVICSARKMYTEKKFVEFAKTYLAKLLRNTVSDDSSDWSLRYFAAQTYIDLYDRTGEMQYLREAFDLVFDNASYLVEEQNGEKGLNAVYLAKIDKLDVPKKLPFLYSAKEKEMVQYNEMLEEQRKKELPPVNDPLLLNCDLLFSLANKLNISKMERKEIDNILRRKSDNVFLVTPLDNLYRFGKFKEINENIDFSNELTKATLTIPASLVTSKAIIKASVSSEEGSADFSDWELKEVTRKKDGDISTFNAIYESKTAHNFDYVDNSKLTLIIQPMADSKCEEIAVEYNIHLSKIGPVTNVKFEKVSE